MESKGFEGMACSIANVMGALGDRWGILVMRDILLGLTRYQELQESSGVTNATLSDRLKKLENNGLIERRLYQASPARYEYVPSDKGNDIGLLMIAMVQIGDKWDKLESKAPPLRFINKHSGNNIKLAVVDDKTGQTVSANDIEAIPGEGADEITKWRLHLKNQRQL